MYAAENVACVCTLRLGIVGFGALALGRIALMDEVYTPSQFLPADPASS